MSNPREFPVSRAAARQLAIALHCSGGTAGQWRLLADRLGPEYRFLAPNLHGSPGGPVWSGERRFHLTDEAQAILSAIDDHPGPVHLVGHSFGGALALHIASQRPGRIASLALYEPSAFHLLKHFGGQGSKALREIGVIVSGMRDKCACGAWREAAECFVDYWNGRGAWNMMRPELQTDLIRFLPKAQMDFHALINETVPLEAYLRIACPVRFLRGEHAPFPTRLIAEELAYRLPDTDIVKIDDAGHMGPLTHAGPVAHAIAAHISLSRIETEAGAA